LAARGIRVETPGWSGVEAAEEGKPAQAGWEKMIEEG
jgi:hypothetical protein